MDPNQENHANANGADANATASNGQGGAEGGATGPDQHINIKVKNQVSNFWDSPSFLCNSIFSNICKVTKLSNLH